jgi:hypothetical protein
MSDAGRKMVPPPQYGDLNQLEQIFAANLPQLATHMSGLFGKRTPRLVKKEMLKQNAKLHRFLVAARPYLLGLRAVSAEADKHQCIYALLEGLLREQFKAGGKKIPENKDSFEYLLKSAERMASSPNRALAKSEPYLAAKQAMYELVVSLHQRANPLVIDELVSDWARSKDARKFVQSVVHWPILVRQFRVTRPKRLTARLAHQLASEYRVCSSLLEQRIRFLVSLDQGVSNSAKKWIDWEKVSLFDLLKQAETSPQLNWIPPLIERRVRNALAHGEPEVNQDHLECRFHDRNVTVAWKIADFFENTKRLTLTVCALMQFESILQLVQVRILITNLWGGLASSREAPP